MGTAPHGTSVAGLIGAEIDNGEGGVGVAWGTSITGVNIFSPGTYGYVNAADDRPFLHVVHQAIDLFDIMSDSWGSFPLYDLLYQNLTNPLSDAARLNDVYSELEEEGRGGPGVIINQAAGNDTVDANGSGVTALMLEANPGLGWRDVQDILATSASYTGTMDGSGTYEVDDWGFNNGTSVNGGGQHINGSYGYGIVNAYNSVPNAEVWSLFGAAEISANERMVGSDRLDLGGVKVPDGSTTGHTFTLDVSEDLEIDTVMLNLNTVAYDIGDLLITLMSPDGTEIIVKFPELAGLFSQIHYGTTWSYGIEQLRGESAYGTWTITVADLVAGNATYLYAAGLDIYGSAVSDDDVHHVNDEFLEMLALDPSRGTLEDLAGNDWLNFAAVAGDVHLDMDSTGAGFADVGLDAWFAIAPGTVLENAVTGDGADTIFGNDADNMLYGMRGNDYIFGGPGGANIIDGGDGHDTLEGGNQGDTISGGNGADTIKGGNGDDLIDGGIGNDHLYGNDDADTFRFDGMFGNDVVHDFLVGTDTIEIIGYTAGDLTLTATGGNTLVEVFGVSDTIEILGSVLTDFSDFVFG